MTLVDDPSSGCSWQRGEEVCPPMYPVRAQPSGEEIWAESRYISLFHYPITVGVTQTDCNDAVP